MEWAEDGECLAANPESWGVLDLKQGKLKALGAVVYVSGVKKSFYRTSSAATFVLAAMWQGAFQEALNSSVHGFFTCTPLQFCWSWLLVMVEVSGSCGLC